MFMRHGRQATVASKIEFDGVGVHSGKPVCMTVYPGAVGSGIRFERLDLKAAAVDHIVPAQAPLVSECSFGTSICNDDGVSVHTIEHLLAAFAICGVSNAHVVITSAELPIMDGSAAPFAAAISQVGVADQKAALPIISLDAPLEVRDEERVIRIEPGDERLIDIIIDFPDKAIGRQAETLDLQDEIALLERLAPARTFCRLDDIEPLRAAGFCLGGSLENAVVVGADRVINEEGLRDPSEFVLHKALDLIGDLFLVGGLVFGRITAYKPGHDLNTKMAKLLAEMCAQKLVAAPKVMQATA